MYLAGQWREYQVLDTGDGDKLERWGRFTLCRPDPQVIWPAARPALWAGADARYHRSDRGGGQWTFRTDLPQRWIVGYGDLRFYVRPTGFKHTGLFPEQAVNWDWMRALVQGAGREISVLNLFGYTGGATCALAAAGAKVCHVDAAKGMVAWAKENAALCRVPTENLRFIVEDAQKFVERELRRGRRYDAVLMDPPSYGRGPDGSVWKLEERIYPLLERCAALLSDKPLFFLLNAYTTGLAPAVLRNLLQKTVCTRFGGRAEADEVGLPVLYGDVVLPCGASGRWVAP